MNIIDTALIGLAVAILTVVCAWWFISRSMARRAGKFDSLAKAYRCTVESGDQAERHFALNVHNRDFKVAAHYSRGRGSGDATSSGVSGYCLSTSTPLNSEAWRQHAVDIRPGEWRLLDGRNMSQKRSGDERFDREFAVSELGSSLPGDWLSGEVRGLVRQCFALSMKQASLIAGAGQLTHHTPWHGDEITPRALEERLRRLGWLAGALDAAAMREPGSSTGTIHATSPYGDDEFAEETASPPVDHRMKYTLARNLLSLGGDYTITDTAGTKRFFAVGKLRLLSAMFSLQDAKRKVLFVGREHAWNLDQKFDISSDGRRHATVVRQMVGGRRKIFGTPAYRYLVTLAGGEEMEATGVFASHWTLRRRNMTVANVETDGDVSEIGLGCDARDVPLVLTIVMAIVRLNRPSRTASTAD